MTHYNVYSKLVTNLDHMHNNNISAFKVSEKKILKV